MSNSTSSSEPAASDATAPNTSVTVAPGPSSSEVTVPTAAAVTASQKPRPRFGRSDENDEGDRVSSRQYRSAAIDSAKRGPIAKATPKRKSVGSVGHRGQRGGHAATK